MSLIDVLIVLFVVASLFRGKDIGFVRQVCSAVGFFGGLWLGTLLAPHLVPLAHSPAGRSIFTLLATLGSAFILLSLGETLGIWLKTHVRWRLLDRLDAGLGAGVGALSILLAVWFSASIALSVPSPRLQTAVKSSHIINALNNRLPPATTVIADLSHLIDPNGSPQVFTNREPAPNANVALPKLSELGPAINATKSSVVKIEGQGCGGIVEGSGFVAASGLVITNAHVVAGIDTPLILDDNGTHRAKVIWFDPNLDIAVMRANKLAGKPLTITTTKMPRGTAGAILGYPGGGDFTVEPAAVLEEFNATGRNIYGHGATNRDVYELKADIIPGNSGGPVVGVDGQVYAVVFAESTAYNHVGYALQTDQVSKVLRLAESSNRQVSTGTCAE